MSWEQEWGAHVSSTQEYLMDQPEIERLEAQNRPLTPLLATEQQIQIKSISSQHEARLGAQKKLSAALTLLLASAGTLWADFFLSLLHLA